MSMNVKVKEQKPSIIKAIDRIGQATRFEIGYKNEVERAFLLGLWWRQFPEYMHEHLERVFDWDIKNIDPEVTGNFGANFEKLYPHIFKFSFISETGTSWHQCYRDIRAIGWKRTKVHRNGGNLQYLFEVTRDWMPEGYSTLHLLLNISISTCKQVQVGTEMKEVPVYRTECEDLRELDDDKEDAMRAEAIYPAADEGAEAEVIPLVVIDDIDELQRRRKEDPNSPEYEKAHGPEGQIPRKSEYSGGDSIFDYERTQRPNKPDPSDEIPF